MSVQKEDVYETEDVPSPEPVESEENFENKEVEKIHFDVKGAMKRFGTCFLDSDGVDFSDTLMCPRVKRGYRTSELFQSNADESEFESFEQKYHRLYNEVGELIANYDNYRQSDAKQLGLKKTQLEQLNDLVRAAAIKQTKQSVVEDENFDNSSLQTTSKKSSDTDELLNLDERIKRIEKAVHGDKKSSRIHLGPLIETVENLRVQVESLNPSYLDGVASQLNAALMKLAEFEEKRSKHANDELDQKVVELYDMFSKWEGTFNSIPSILKRLHTLSKLHEQAQNFSSKLNELAGMKQHLVKKSEDHQMTLFEMKKESTKVVEELFSKIAELEKRVSSL